MQLAAELDRDRIGRLQAEVDELRGCRQFAVEAENQIIDLNNQIQLLQEEAQLGKVFKVGNDGEKISLTWEIMGKVIQV